MRGKAVIIVITGLLGMAVAGISSQAVELEYPAYFPSPVYNFSNNPLTEAGINLGRALFYDPLLSKDGTVSCASCHSSYNAFAHTDHDLSHGINDQIGTRNAPALFNLAWQSSFMWDGAVNHLDMQALAPISHPAEMDEELSKVIEKLRSKSLYRKLSYQAFGDSLMTGEHLLKAFAQFQLTLVSANAKYDEVKKGEARFTVQEQSGYELFIQHCNSCHTEPLFSSYGFADNGLPIDTTLNDFGRWMITKQAADRMQFKTPSLRNLSYSYPYMHDGRFRKLSQVLDHYNGGIEDRETLAEALVKPIILTNNDQADLIAFLLTLNDQEFVFHKDHQYPRNIFSESEGF